MEASKQFKTEAAAKGALTRMAKAGFDRDQYEIVQGSDGWVLQQVMVNEPETVTPTVEEPQPEELVLIPVYHDDTLVRIEFPKGFVSKGYVNSGEEIDGKHRWFKESDVEYTYKNDDGGLVVALKYKMLKRRRLTSLLD